MAKIVTGNELRSGAVVFLAETGWSASVDEALVAEDEEALSALMAAADQAKAANLVVDVYATDVRREGCRLIPVHYREVMRTKGPTVRADLGYQAGQGIRFHEKA